MTGDNGTAKALSSGELMKLLAGDDEDDDDEVDTSVVQLDYQKTMQGLAKARLKLVELKRNIPPPEKP